MLNSRLCDNSDINKIVQGNIKARNTVGADA